MPGLGTIINTAAIIIGGIIGLFFGKLIPERMQNALMMGNGICVIFVGAAGAISKMLVLNEGGISYGFLYSMHWCYGHYRFHK